MIELSFWHDHLAVVIFHLQVVSTLLLCVMMLVICHDQFALAVELL